MVSPKMMVADLTGHAVPERHPTQSRRGLRQADACVPCPEGMNPCATAMPSAHATQVSGFHEKYHTGPSWHRVRRLRQKVALHVVHGIGCAGRRAMDCACRTTIYAQCRISGTDRAARRVMQRIVISMVFRYRHARQAKTVTAQADCHGMEQGPRAQRTGSHGRGLTLS